jgi:cyanophycin synthetase
MNVFDEHGFRVILDYGHNEAAVGAMVDLVERLKPLGKRIVCVTCPGDRRDEDIRDIAGQVAGNFDLYLCHGDDNPRGRAPDEVPKLLRQALIESGVSPEQISLAESEEQSVQSALEMARPTDLVLVFCDNLTRSWKQIIYFRPDGAPAPAHTSAAIPAPVVEMPTEAAAPLSLEGLIRDERGIRYAPEAAD